jgi:hypothetical protein
MKNTTRFLLLFALFLSGCTRAYPGSWPEIVSDTSVPVVPTAPLESAAAPADTAVPTEASYPTQPTQTRPAQAQPDQPTAQAALSPTATALPAKPTIPVLPEFQQALMTFPLVSGDSWIYTYKAYTGKQTATWRIADTVTSTRLVGKLWAASMERQVELISGTPGSDFINLPKASTTWWVIELGTEPGSFSVYRSDDMMNLDHLADSRLEFVFPLSEGAACWFPDAATRQLAPGENTPGCRKAGASYTAAYPAGSFMGCVDLMTPYNDGPILQTFCPTVGIAGGKYDHRGTSFGYTYELVAYLLQ